MSESISVGSHPSGKIITVKHHVLNQSYYDEKIAPLLKEGRSTVLTFEHCVFDAVKIDSNSYAGTSLTSSFVHCAFTETVITGFFNSILFLDCETKTLEPIRMLGNVANGCTFKDCYVDVDLVIFGDRYSFYNVTGNINLINVKDTDLQNKMNKTITVLGGNRLSINGYKSFITLPNMGRDSRDLNYNAITDEVTTGCFRGSLEAFKEAVEHDYHNHEFLSYDLTTGTKMTTSPTYRTFFEQCRRKYDLSILLFAELRQAHLDNLEKSLKERRIVD